MCFLARLKAQGSEQNNLILIDEPALFLHAKAQKDVLSLLEEIASDNNQVVFSTHSPFLIDTDKLNRIRLVTKDKTSKITLLENNFNKNADIETIAPIVAAIGLDISQGIIFSKKHNLVVEGTSDYYYLQAMRKYLVDNTEYNFPHDMAFIPCVGESKITSVISLLVGYGLDYKVLLDEKGTRHTRNKLHAEGLDDKIITAGTASDESIEDLFSEKDRENYITSQGDLSKTLISKIFYEKVEKGEHKTFTQRTLNAFIKLLDNIKPKTVTEGADKGPI